jgi:hypothetical protein
MKIFVLLKLFDGATSEKNKILCNALELECCCVVCMFRDSF